MPTQPKPILSILVPTFNRSESLIELVDSISIYSQGVEEFIEVVIGDNSDESNSYFENEAFKEFQGKIQIQYKHWGQNLGYDRNLTALIQEAKGLYGWFLGDRLSVVNPLLNLVKVLQSNDLQFIAFINLLTLKGQRSAEGELLDALEGFSQPKDSVLIRDSASFGMGDVGVLDASISAKIFPIAPEFTRDTSLFSKYVGSQFMHVPIFYESAKSSSASNVAIALTPYVENRTKLQIVRFDPVLTALGWHLISQDYQLGSVDFHDNSLNYFLHNGLKSYRLGLSGIGIKTYRDFLKAIQQLQIPMTVVTHVQALVYGLTPVWILRLLYVTLRILKGDIAPNVRSVVSIFRDMHRFDLDSNDFRLDSKRV